jgi:hydroxymethylbilane synthase
MSLKALRVGTRGSKLALKQTELVMSSLKAVDQHLDPKRIIIKTRGDRILDSPLSKIGGKGLFIREIEEALLEGVIDIAVHSLKDLPTEFPEGLELGGVLKRGDPRDALVSRNGRKLGELTDEDRVATSSLRRRAQLLHLRPGLEVVDIRGNVDTRLRKLEEGESTAVVLAASGLQRAGHAHRITEYLDPAVMLPAVGQGIIAIEKRGNDEEAASILQHINHQDTFMAAEAERRFMRILEGGCQVPIGCLCSIENGKCRIQGLIASLEGDRVIEKSVSGATGDRLRLAEQLAGLILKEGGDRILEELRYSREAG